MTSDLPSIRRTSSTITTATTITENGSDINDNCIKISDNLVNDLDESDAKIVNSFGSDVKNDVIDSVVVDNSVDNNCVKSRELCEQNQTISKQMNSKLINLLSPNISTTIEPSVPEPTGPGPGFATIVSADSESVTISVPEINLSPKLEPIKEIEVTPPAKPPPKKKSYKKSANPRKLLPCKDREYDPNKHCGVCLPEMERPCTRSLTCKTHSLTLRRAVQGRIKNFDELLAEHREAKEAALRAQGIEVKPTKKAIQKQQQQLRASQQLQLKAEENQQLISNEKSISTQPLIPMTRTIVFSESQPMVSNINANSNSLLSFVSSPISSINERAREPVLTPPRSHLRLDQIEVESDGSMYMSCHPKPAAVCNFNIRRFDRMRLLSRNNDLTLSALRSTFNSPVLVSKLTNNQKCSSTQSPIAIKSPLRNANQTFSANKKLRISIDSESLESSSDAGVDPYNFLESVTSSATSNSYTYVKPKTTTPKTTNVSKKKKKSDINCSTYNSSLLSNGQLFHSTTNSTKTTGSAGKKKSVVKKNVNNSDTTSVSTDVLLTNSSAGSDSIDSVVSPNSEQLNDPSTSLISEVPQRNLNVSRLFMSPLL